MKHELLMRIFPCLFVLTLTACGDESANHVDVTPRASVDDSAPPLQEASSAVLPLARPPASMNPQGQGGELEASLPSASSGSGKARGSTTPAVTPPALPAARSVKAGANPTPEPRVLSGRELRARPIEEKRATALFPRSSVTPDPDQVDVVPMLNLNGAIVPEALITDLVPDADPRLLLPEQIQDAPTPSQTTSQLPTAADATGGNATPAGRPPTFEEIVAGNVPNFCPPPEAAWSGQPVDGYWPEQFAFIGCMGFD